MNFLNIIFLSIIYVFSPDLSEKEINKVQNYLKISNNFIKTEEILTNNDIINTYKNGLYEKYIELFEENYKSFAFYENNSVNYKDIYLFYILSLKILNNEKYNSSICLINQSLDFYEKIPEFVKNENYNCNKLNKINIILKSSDLKIYINGLQTNQSLFYVKSIPYNLTICNNSECRYFKTKNTEINDEYLKYFDFSIKNNNIFAKNIEKSMFNYFLTEEIHYFYKNNDDIYHIIQNKDKILSNNVLFLSNITKNDKKNESLFKKWYFYAITLTGVALFSGGAYWYLKEDPKNTNIHWEY